MQLMQVRLGMCVVLRGGVWHTVRLGVWRGIACSWDGVAWLGVAWYRGMLVRSAWGGVPWIAVRGPVMVALLAAWHTRTGHVLAACGCGVLRVGSHVCA